MYTVQGVSVAPRSHGRAADFAGGAVPTPLFLLQNGLCNSSGQVGRNLSLHPSGGFAALFDEEIQGHKYIPQGYGIDEFLPDKRKFYLY